MKKRTGVMTKKLKRKTALFMTPSVCGVATFFVIPFLVVIFYSLVDNPVRKNWVFLDNYISIVQNKAFRLAVTNTVKFSLISVPLIVVLSLLVAFALDKNVVGKSQIRSSILSPMMVPIASVILIWQVLFDNNGIVNEFLSHYDIARIDWMKSDSAQIVIIILFIWKNLGYNMILFMAAISNIPKDLIEVARLESASDWVIFRTIKIRYLASTILFVTIMSLINSFKVFREIYLLTGDYPYEALYMMQHYMNNMFAALDYQKLSAAAILMSIVMIILVGLLFIIENFVGRDLED
ncbi:MAG: sugar ABC transporter permease [Lachnospiraceae bacterium]|nr:sugar ABC transporter permease [Lachnospiraceae bacterium]